MTAVEMALAYAARGWRVFPVLAKDQPLVKWGTEATTDENAIREMWRGKRNTNIGIACGNGLVVVDLDVHDPVNANGLDNWPKLLADTGIQLEESPLRVRTPSGGMHLYFSTGDADWRNEASKLAPGIDVRGDGGYVVAPGGPGEYKWIAGFDPNAELPVLPVELIPQRNEPVEQTEVREPRTMREANTLMVEMLVDLRTAVESTRNDTLNKAAYVGGSLVAEGLLAEDYVRSLLLDGADTVGLGLAESKATVASGFTSGVRDHTKQRPSTREILFGERSKVRVLWGAEERPLWIHGQSLMVVGPPGAGKSTLAQMLVGAQLGLLNGEVLGHQVTAAEGNVLYLSLDRPFQIVQSMQRVFTEELPDALLDRLVIVDELSCGNLDDYPSWLREQASEFDASTVVIDSLFDAVSSLTDDKAAIAYNKGRQALMKSGIDLLEVHHDRKRTTDGHGGKGKLDDTYGSRWLTSGAGSVLLLIPMGGDDDGPRNIWLRQRKSIRDVNPKILMTFRAEDGLLAAGSSMSIADQIDMTLLIALEPMKARDLAEAVLQREPSVSEVESIRRQADRLVASGQAVKPAKGYYARRV